MMTFLLIYTHIAALVLGLVLEKWRTTRKDFWLDLFVLLFVTILWPITVWLMIEDERKGR